ncbi:MAG: diacylglycerol kinase family lipid kinase [Anaerolineales bacterium]|nr:diacylglycerol kinase family lipid kinase [Anaerolineales bacterium]
MTAKVILNPYSNRWNAEKRWPDASIALNDAGVDFELVVSERHGHTIELAEQAARQGFSPIIAAGGDGTIGEVVNGLARAAVSEATRLGPLGILPLGSANDLVANLGLSTDLRSAAQVIAAGQTRVIDICRVNELYFVNNSAMGLEPYVTLIQQRITWIKGIPRYMVAALRGVLDKPRWNVKIEWDDGRFEGPVLLVTVGNGPRTGGVFFMAPHASLTDGKMTFVYGFRDRRRDILRLLPLTMRPGEGSYVETDGIFEHEATWIRIQVETPAPAHTDGEIFSEGIQELEYRIQPGRLAVLASEGNV